jgi:glycosyltransferase involved in cell wall biosynthesis
MPKPKKVLFIHHAVTQGGAPNSLAYLIRGLSREEFEPIVVMPKRNGPSVIRNLFVDAGAKVYEEKRIYPFGGVHPGRDCSLLKDKIKAWGGAFLTQSAIRKIASEILPDLVHVNSAVLPFASRGVKKALPDIPVVAHIRETIVDTNWGEMLAKLNRRYSDFFIGIDQHGLDKIGANKNQSKVVRNFVDREQFYPDEAKRAKYREQMNWTDEKTVFLSLARISQANGSLDFANLINNLDSQLPASAVFAFAGFTNDPNQPYEKLALNEINKSKRLVALPFESDVVSLINACDVIVAPFVSAHSARSVLEASAIGKPSLVSDLPNLLELIIENDTGFSFRWSDESLFVEKIRQLSSLELRTQMKKNCIEFAKANFDALTNIRSVETVYRSLMTTRDSIA